MRISFCELDNMKRRGCRNEYLRVFCKGKGWILRVFLYYFQKTWYYHHAAMPVYRKYFTPAILGKRLVKPGPSRMLIRFSGH